MNPLMPPIPELRRLGLLLLCSLLLAIACTPKVLHQGPAPQARVDTVPLLLPPPPPLVLPPDSAELTLDMDLLCDSLWRSQHPVLTQLSPSRQLSAKAEIHHNKLRLTCREDSLLVLLDSVRSYALHISEPQTYYTVEYRCPYGWPKYLHMLLIACFALCVLLIALLSLKRLR